MITIVIVTIALVKTLSELSSRPVMHPNPPMLFFPKPKAPSLEDHHCSPTFTSS